MSRIRILAHDFGKSYLGRTLMKRIVLNLAFCISIGLIQIFGQGTKDTSFGSNGVVTISYPGERIFGTAVQNLGANKNKIIIATQKGNELRVRRLTANGQVDTTFGTGANHLHLVSINSSAIEYNGISVDQNDDIHYSITKPSQIGFVNANGTNLPSAFGGTFLTQSDIFSPFTNIPNPNLTITKVASFGGNDYLIGTSGSNTGSTTFAASINSPQFVPSGGKRIPIGPAGTMSIAFGIASSSTRVYLAMVYMTNLVPKGTAIISFDLNGNFINTGFGNMKYDFSSGQGLYQIPGFIVKDMTFADGHLYLGGTNTANNFEVIKYRVPGTSHRTFASVDFTGIDEPQFIVVKNGNILVGGKTKIANTTSFAVAKYDPTLEKLTNAWNPAKLHFIDPLSSSNANPSGLPNLAGDARVIIMTTPLAPFSSNQAPTPNQRPIGLLVQTAPQNRILCVSSFITNPTGNNDVLFITALKD